MESMGRALVCYRRCMGTQSTVQRKYIALLHVYKVYCGGRKLTRSGEWKLARSREWKLSQSPEPETGFPQDEMYLRLDD